MEEVGSSRKLQMWLTERNSEEGKLLPSFFLFCNSFLRSPANATESELREQKLPESKWE